jgi:hypothetical protein
MAVALLTFATFGVSWGVAHEGWNVLDSFYWVNASGGHLDAVLTLLSCCFNAVLTLF